MNKIVTFVHFQFTYFLICVVTSFCIKLHACYTIFQTCRRGKSFLFIDGKKTRHRFLYQLGSADKWEVLPEVFFYRYVWLEKVFNIPLKIGKNITAWFCILKHHRLKFIIHQRTLRSLWVDQGIGMIKLLPLVLHFFHTVVKNAHWVFGGVKKSHNLSFIERNQMN